MCRSGLPRSTRSWTSTPTSCRASGTPVTALTAPNSSKQPGLFRRKVVRKRRWKLHFLGPGRLKIVEGGARLRFRHLAVLGPDLAHDVVGLVVCLRRH